MSVDRSEKILYGVEFKFDKTIHNLEDYPNIPGFPELEVIQVDPMGNSVRQFVFVKGTYKNLDDEVIVMPIGSGLFWPPGNNINDFLAEYNLTTIGNKDWYLICDYW